MKTMKFRQAKNLNTFCRISKDAEKKFLEVNKPLPWIEPSINMIHLDAVRSFVLGSSLASIGCTTYLLEHTLRMAIWDPINAGSLRIKPTKDILEATFGQLLEYPQYTYALNKVIPKPSELDWWKDVKKAVRNKVNHVDIPAVFRIAKELKFNYDYAYSGLEGPSSWDTENPHTWGLFWHRYGEKIASDFITQATDHVLKLFDNTTWKSDESWWISQKFEYDAFFQENWEFNSLKKSLNEAYDDDGGDDD
jgi:hypothetical protein